MDTSSTEFEPFQSSGSEYEPSDSEQPSTSTRSRDLLGQGPQSTPVVPKVKRGRKRQKCKAKWTRNVRKNLKARGEEHVNTAKKLIPKRVVGNDCSCPRQCFSMIDAEKRILVLETFNKLGNKEKQDIYLSGLISSVPVARRRLKTGERPEKTVSHLYKIRVGSETYQVCRKAFVAVHGITKHRTDRIASYLKAGIIAPPDKRGKHETRPNKIPEEVIRQVDEHIKSFPKRSSHYSREKNDGKYYLPPELNVLRMHKLYLEKYERDVFDQVENGEACQPKVTYDFFYRHFVANYNIGFGAPRSDTCQTCDRLSNLIDGEKNIETKNAFKTEKQLHIRKSEVFYTSLKEKTVLAKNNADVDTLCFDFEQNLPLPHVPSGDVFYKRQIWQYNFCIYSAKTGISTFYMFDEITGKKGSNEVISFLQNYIETFVPREVTTLYLFSDNAFAQNKNQTLVKYLYTIVNMGNNIRAITHQYPEPGHSFLPCDRSFGLIEKNKRRMERVYIPEEWQNLVKSTSKKFRVVNVPQEMILNYAEHFKGIYKKTITGTNKQKFAVSTYRLFKYDTTSFIQCSVSSSMEVFSTFSIKKQVQEISLPSSPAYNNPLPLNPKKICDCRSLVAKYVPMAYQGYYIRAFGESVLGAENPEGTRDEANDEGDETDSSFL